MADVSIGSVSLGMQLDKVDLLSQMKDITQSAASMLQNGLSNALNMGNSKVDLSGIIGGVGEVKNEVKALSTMIGTAIEKGMSTGAKDGAKAVAAVTATVATVKMPTVKVTATKSDLTNQLSNMVALLDNTNAQIYTQQQMVDELKRKWNAMGNLGQQDSDAGLKMQKSILVAEAALTSLEGKSDTMAMKTRAMESAIDNFGTSGAQSVEKVVAAATSVDKKINAVGNSGNTAGKKVADGMNSANKSVKNLSSSAMSATGIEKRLSSIESNVAKTTRSVTALGRRFLVLFTGKIISAAFKDITAGLTGASNKSKDLKTNLNSIATAGKTISNAVVTAIAPLINIVAPQLSSITEMVRVFANRVAMTLAFVSGQSTVLQAKKTFAAYTAGATSAGNAAEKAQKQMAGFDNLNILQSPTTASSSGGSSGGADTSGADFETVATQGSDFAKKISDAINTLKGPLSDFYEYTLKPLGAWIMGDGINLLATGLENVAQFFKDNPKLIDNLAVFLATILPLSALGPVAVVLGVTVQATVAAIEWLGGRDVGESIKTTFSASLPDVGAALASLLWNGFIDADTWADGTFLDTVTEWILSTLGQDGLYGIKPLLELGANIAESIINGFIYTWNALTPDITIQINSFLASIGKDPISLYIKPIDFTPWNDATETVDKSTRDQSRTYDDYLYNLAASTGKTYAQVKKTIETGTRDQNRTYQDFLYNQTSSTGKAYETIKTTVNIATKGAANYLITNTASGINTSLGSYSGMPSAVQTRLANLTKNVSDSSSAAAKVLYDQTNLGVNNTVSLFSRLSNDATLRMLRMANNSRLALLNILNNMGLLPKTTDQASVNAATGKILGGQLASLPMYANGAYLQANTPHLAIVGDNKTQGEIVTPEDAMAAAVAKGIAAAGDSGSGQTINITVQSVLDGKVIATSTTKYQKEAARKSNKPAFA